MGMHAGSRRLPAWADGRQACTGETDFCPATLWHIVHDVGGSQYRHRTSKPLPDMWRCGEGAVLIHLG